MGGISEENVEWAVVNRLKAMLDHPPKTDFNVTLGFSLFCTILLWTKNRMWVTVIEGAADTQAAAARAQLGETLIIDAPWNLSMQFPANHEPGEVNADFATMKAADFFNWLRNALAHGDGRTIRPLHWTSATTGKEWLGGFLVMFPETKGSDRILTLHLFKGDIQRMGQQLADLFCRQIAKEDAYRFQDSATNRMLEEGSK